MTVELDHESRDESELGKRFRFGRNWRRFLRTVDERSIREAERRLTGFLGVSSLNGQTFLDVGSGSGLHSLAARRLGAEVVSFDYDPESVEATRQLRSKFDRNGGKWLIEAGSVLDTEYLTSLGKFDIVYSWGVLHHTGAMWEALEKIQIPVKEGGKLYIAIYNDSGAVSRWWLKHKKRYCELPFFLRPAYFLWIYVPMELKGMNALRSLRRGRIDQAFRKAKKYLGEGGDYKKNRGMSRFHDMVDWLGGYPYEFAEAEDLVSFYEQAGFRLLRLARNDGTGNHELLFVKGPN
jgi:2-polyprenyl-6-hydroxyphenyl methylase/3-demethylubiquinone-9 3-methyltransferase